ncbi:MAG: hypothetical protein K2N06_06730, partial [Oscillospiraceae bacterium]|nr:hypothetical protein [Oscillospiraceae bacterium]
YREAVCRDTQQAQMKFDKAKFHLHGFGFAIKIMQIRNASGAAYREAVCRDTQQAQMKFDKAKFHLHGFGFAIKIRS